MEHIDILTKEYLEMINLNWVKKKSRNLDTLYALLDCGNKSPKWLFGSQIKFLFLIDFFSKVLSTNILVFDISFWNVIFIGILYA